MKRDEAALHDTDTNQPKKNEQGGLIQPVESRDDLSHQDSTSTPESHFSGEPHAGTAKTTHDAYDTSEGHNKLHKEPPAKVLKEHGLE